MATRRRRIRQEQVEEAYLWTPVATLIEQGLAHGLGVREIALTLGPSRRTIERWANRYGVALPRNPGRKKQVQ